MRPLPPLALAYHGVADVPLRRDPHGLFVRPRDLRRHVARLRQWGYELVTFGELARRDAAGDAYGLAALTFDDGLVDNLGTLVPLLRDEAAPATVFVVSGWLGRPHPDAPWTRILTGGELRTLADAGVEIGAHSRSHADLSRLAPAEARAELAESKRDLETILGRPVDVAAYPYGRATEATVAACREAGFVAACRSSSRGSWKEPHNLPREDMDNRCTLLGLRLKRDGRYERLVRHRPAQATRQALRRMRAAAR